MSDETQLDPFDPDEVHYEAFVDVLAMLAEQRLGRDPADLPDDEASLEALRRLYDDDAEGTAGITTPDYWGYGMDELEDDLRDQEKLDASAFVAGRVAEDDIDLEELTDRLGYRSAEFSEDKNRLLDGKDAEQGAYIVGITREQVLERLVVRELNRRLQHTGPIGQG
jgi:hypothetical protein